MMVKELQSLDLDKMRLYVSMGTLITVLGAVWYFSSWKTEVDLIIRQERVSPSDFAVVKNDVSYIKESVRTLLEKK